MLVMRTKNFIKNPKVFGPVLAYLILLGPLLYAYSGSPSETEPQVYRGAWLPHVLPSALGELKDMGMNTIFLQGFPDDVGTVTIQTAHRHGLKVALTLAVMGFDTPEAADLDMDVLNSQIVDLAKFAEKWGVEFFAPFNEPENIFGEDTARWAQEILPRIKEVYHGQVIWKGARAGGDGLSGYDYIGFPILPIEDMTSEEYTRYVDNQIDKALGFCAAIDSCRGIMITQFGGRESIDPWRGEEGIASGHEIVLERGKDKVAGFFYWDEIPGVFGEWEQEISAYYREMP